MDIVAKQQLFDGSCLVIQFKHIDISNILYHVNNINVKYEMNESEIAHNEKNCSSQLVRGLIRL